MAEHVRAAAVENDRGRQASVGPLELPRAGYPGAAPCSDHAPARRAVRCKAFMKSRPAIRGGISPGSRSSSRNRDERAHCVGHVIGRLMPWPLPISGSTVSKDKRLNPLREGWCPGEDWPTSKLSSCYVRAFSGNSTPMLNSAVVPLHALVGNPAKPRVRLLARTGDRDACRRILVLEDSFTAFPRPCHTKTGTCGCIERRVRT